MPVERAVLPINRKQLFKDVLKNRYRVLLLMGMVLFLFALPLIVVSLINDLTLVSFFADSNNVINGEMTDSGKSLYQSMVLNFTLFYSGCFLIYGVGLAGASRIIRQLCWGEGIQFFDSFGKGIKQNVVRFLVLTTILDVVFIAIRFLIVNVDVLWAVVLVAALGGFVFLPVVIFCFGYSAIYFNPFPKAFANSALLAVKHYPIALSLSALFILPFLIEIIPSGLAIIKTIALSLLMLMILPILLFVGGLLLNSIFDKEINTENHKDIYRKGLF